MPEKDKQTQAGTGVRDSGMDEETKKEHFYQAPHSHTLEDGTVITHTHEQTDGHTHEHTHGDTHEHTHGDTHEHTHEHTYEQTHGHIHEHTHSHGHTHQNTRAVLNRLSRAIGHLEKVRSMVEEGQDCCEVLIQLSAVKAAINNTGKLILKDHIEHCIVDAVSRGDMEAVEELTKAIDQFVK